MSKKVPKTIPAYIDGYPKEVQSLLRKMRATIRKAAPEAKERISYGIPTFTLRGFLVHFAAFKKHIGFYPGSQAMKVFRKELSKYKSGPGSVQFPFDKALPLALVTRITKFRVKRQKE